MKKRLSQKKLITNYEINKKYKKKYIILINKLRKKYKINYNPGYSNLVNFKESKKLSVLNWFNYKQGYSSLLVDKILKENSAKKINKILDPFCGVGTTNFVANKYKIKNCGLDINPVALLAAEVKNYSFNINEINIINNLINNFIPKKTKFTPRSKVLESSFDKRTFQNLLGIKGFWENISNKPVKKFFQLAYISIIETCSNKIKDGNGIKYAPNKKPIKNIYNFFIDKTKTMLKEIKLNKKKSTFIEGSLLNKKIPKDFDLVIFSPPYANCFDYFEVYKLEMWMGGFVENYSDFDKYRSRALRSHVNSKFDHTIKNYNKTVDTIAFLISSYNIWNKNIPDMVRGYFDDMNEIFRKLFYLMKKNSSCFVVVANSGYKGVLVPTDLLFCQISEKIGFKVKKITVARKMRASSQQLLDLKINYQNMMRETILELKK